MSNVNNTSYFIVAGFAILCAFIVIIYDNKRGKVTTTIDFDRNSLDSIIDEQFIDLKKLKDKVDELKLNNIDGLIGKLNDIKEKIQINEENLGKIRQSLDTQKTRINNSKRKLSNDIKYETNWIRGIYRMNNDALLNNDIINKRENNDGNGYHFYDINIIKKRKYNYGDCYNFTSNKDNNEKNWIELILIGRINIKTFIYKHYFDNMLDGIILYAKKMDDNEWIKLGNENKTNNDIIINVDNKDYFDLIKIEWIQTKNDFQCLYYMEINGYLDEISCQNSNICYL